ncbi:D-arabinono-1,4-lactone oxidase [Flavilitoribacter nigricans]|uniref:FAD-binding PCMH-type domain-containing protein n=1 Tax=Flavilitoribacter nigricans (strain ATCC 23147 / DSM 23189 / NBRC 102662 / NCIMB 1420 / SS-2) TaxID=1122177 RepID=A0A2D0NHA3_FLAN2|nr:D-arabinono-1,4-lactone oxidase [Flavilitoribacter nigricans]PHN07857.1 hypothetical protein CRP01_03655 [Flavilitoribacter nigricans DSM 23189 = NBRC 102662]
MANYSIHHKWQNSSQTLTADPGTFYQATDKNDLIEIVKKAVAANQKIRVTGGRHSWYPLVLTDQSLGGGRLNNGDICMIDVSKMKTITKEKTADGLYLVHVEPGATMGDLEQATMRDWPDNPAPAPLVALPTNGVIPTELQIGGFIAAGCHGTGWMQPTVPDLVYAIEMILVDEQRNVQVRTFSEANADDPMEAIRVNLGTIGIMTRITFKAEPLFCIHGVDTVDTLMADVINREPDATNHPLKELVESTDYLELFWFPFNETKLVGKGLLDKKMVPDMDKTKVWKKMGTAIKNGADGSPKNCPQNVPSQVWDSLGTKFGGAVYTELAKMLSGNLIDYGLAEGLLTGMNRLAYGTAPDDYVAPATRFFHYQTTAFPVLDFSFAIPMDASTDPYYIVVSDAWYAVVDAVNDWAANKSEYYQRFPVNVALHVRFIKNSQSWLSPAYQPAGSEVHTCWIEFLSGSPTPAAPNEAWYQNYMSAWGDFCRFIGPQWLALGGRPHWAKEWQLLNIPSINIYDKLPDLYGDNLSKFKAVRDELDPTKTFLYSWTEAIFSGQ